MQAGGFSAAPLEFLPALTGARFVPTDPWSHGVGKRALIAGSDRTIGVLRRIGAQRDRP